MKINKKQKEILVEEKEELEKDSKWNTGVVIISFIAAMYGIISRDYFWLILGLIAGVFARNKKEKSKVRINDLEFKLASNEKQDKK